MLIVERKPVPLYELTCSECGSIIRYMASEVSLSHIHCPVCGVSNWAETNVPIDHITQSDLDYTVRTNIPGLM